jgi:hypothetical protein
MNLGAITIKNGTATLSLPAKSIVTLEGTLSVIGTSTTAYVRDGTSANSNFGSATQLQVKKDATGYSRESYLKFDVSSLGTIRSGKLRLYGAASASAALSLGLYAAPSTWNESTLTWNNRPTATLLVSSFTVSGTTSKWYEIDITAFLKSERAAGRSVVTLAIKSNTPSSTMAVFNSDDAASNAPQLVVLS